MISTSQLADFLSLVAPGFIAIEVFRSEYPVKTRNDKSNLYLYVVYSLISGLPTCTCRRLLRYVGFSLVGAGRFRKRSADRDIFCYQIDLTKNRVSTNDLRSRLSFETSYQCEICLRTKKELSGLIHPLKLEIHHVIEFKDGGDESSENLRVYCEECHATVHRIRKSFLRYRANV